MTNVQSGGRSGRRHGGRAAAVAGSLVAVGFFSGAVEAQDGATAAAGAPALTAEQQALALQLQAFQDRMETDFFQRVKRFNGSLDIEERVFDYDMATHTVKVSRGKVVEKAGWYVNTQKKGMPPLVPDPLYSRYMEIDVHPATPHVGMLHATIYFTWLKNGAGMIAGYMDYVPAVVHEEDNQRLKQAVEAVFARHNEDIGRFRNELCESKFGAEHHRDRLKAACVGVSLYAPPMLKATGGNLALVTEAFRAITDTYFAILTERRRQRVSAQDQGALDGMRRRWLEDQMFADTFSRKVVPYEVWSLANLPPTVRF
jgi:coproporphyrinogen III oxidase